MFKHMREHVRESIFEGERHKISTDGKAFFLYRRSEDKWELSDSNSVGKESYREALKGMKEILSLDVPEGDKILKICESGLFRVSNL